MPVIDLSSGGSRGSETRRIVVSRPNVQPQNAAIRVNAWARVGVRGVPRVPEYARRPREPVARVESRPGDAVDPVSLKIFEWLHQRGLSVEAMTGDWARYRVRLMRVVVSAESAARVEVVGQAQDDNLQVALARAVEVYCQRAREVTPSCRRCHLFLGCACT